MKTFYWATLLLGLFFFLVMPAVTIAIPRDMLVASVLAEAPTDWAISLNTNVAQRLSHHNVKNSLVTALTNYQKSLYGDTKWIEIIGVGAVVFSVIGLIRERKICSLKKQVNT